MKLVALLSGGIDSPVAAYKMAMAGAEVVLLHMDNSPYSDDRSRENVRDLAKRLSEVTGTEMPLYFAPHGPSQAAIHEKCDWNYQCVMCKRAMQRTAKEFAKNIGAVGVIMGDSLGQVASQTLKNLVAETHDLDFPLIRPLIGLDKLEIVDIAKEIGTFDISIRPATDCTIVPRKAVTEADPAKIEAYPVDIEGLSRISASGAERVL